MNPLIEHALSVFMAFFAIMNPIANTAVFFGLAGDKNKVEQSRIAAKSLLISFFVIVMFAVLGKSIFHLFGITLSALRITGGILVFLIGYQMLQGSNSKLHTADETTDTDITVSPLAVPLLAGPGTIATAMNYSAAGGWMEIIITLLAFSALSLITFFCFIYSSKILNAVGESGVDIITRLMGLILAVIGVQMLVAGLNAAITFSAISG
ncbi:multiple antibiotic resistance (MarC)-related protein [Paraglaciecola sp. T6c]|uniref:MarC family protein n=1 Tax=Pseudoalteromonas atlantica (strain T6c / ATCC BAA-1087) TaxID=3042615 RepID=UPI00005C5DFF|nr:MarC family protein [Paraglaciecola sp. T6c]ABG39141.1 multiple antibiotic resistance (MarC)-related protein [Paraglaciecola sp. T6c]